MTAPKPRSKPTGILRRILEDGAPRNHRGRKVFADVTVLANRSDPYRQDTPAGHKLGLWFANQAARFWPGVSIHSRGMFYRLVQNGRVRTPNGAIFRNTEKEWHWLGDQAATAARWLGYVPFDSIVDERNGPSQIFVPEDKAPFGGLCEGVECRVPSLEVAMPSFEADFVTRQPYRVVLIGEKTSLIEVLEPIARRIEGELIPFTGEATITRVAELAARAHEDGRRLVVLYFSDFDPAGNQMPISVARKLQALRDLKYPDLEAEVHVVALTKAQCEEYDLPSTPLKLTEQRADKWREVMGREQTEIDALAAVRPDILSQLADDAVAPFVDPTLAERTDEAEAAWMEEAARRLKAHPRYNGIEAEIESALAGVRDAVAVLKAAQDRGLAVLPEIEPPEIELPEPEIDTDAQPAPVFTTDDDFATASRKLIAHKALDDDDD